MNYFFSRIVALSALCCFLNVAYPMDCVSDVICGTLEINSQCFMADYNLALYHEKLTEAGILSCQKNPVIGVFCTIQNKDRLLLDSEKFTPGYPFIVSDNENDNTITYSFDMPINYLWRAKTNTVLSCTINGQQLQLTCLGNEGTRDSFENQVSCALKALKKNLADFTNTCPSVILEELVGNECIKKVGNTYEFGPQGFFNLAHFVLFHDDRCPEVKKLKTNAHLLLSQLQEIQKLYQ